MKLAANLIESYIIYSLCASYWFFYRLQYNEGGQSLFKCEAKFAVQTFNAQKSFHGGRKAFGNVNDQLTLKVSKISGEFEKTNNQLIENFKQ